MIAIYRDLAEAKSLKVLHVMTFNLDHFVDQKVLMMLVVSKMEN